MTAFVDRLHRLPHSPRAARLVAIVAAAFAIAALARLLLVLVAGPVLPVTASAQTATAAPAAPIADWHLFGVAATAPRATALSGLIHGTLARSDPAQGAIFLAAADGSDVRVGVGDSLPGGGVLSAVYADRIQVRYPGREDTIALSDESSTATMATTPATPTTAPLAPGNDLAHLAADGNVLPVFDHGRIVGLRVAIADVAVLERLGLRRDDVITAINGVPVGDPARLAPLLQTSRPTLSLRRGGRLLELTPGT